jgi:fatty-acid desaturase
VAILTYGEGWHNNHHALQTSARHGMKWWEFDPTFWTIIAMEKVGLAHSVKHPRITKATAKAVEEAGEGEERKAA